MHTVCTNIKTLWNPWSGCVIFVTAQGSHRQIFHILYWRLRRWWFLLPLSFHKTRTGYFCFQQKQWDNSENCPPACLRAQKGILSQQLSALSEKPGTNTKHWDYSGKTTQVVQDLVLQKHRECQIVGSFSCL